MQGSRARMVALKGSWHGRLAILSCIIVTEDREPYMVVHAKEVLSAHILTRNINLKSLPLSPSHWQGTPFWMDCVMSGNMWGHRCVCSKTVQDHMRMFCSICSGTQRWSRGITIKLCPQLFHSCDKTQQQPAEKHMQAQNDTWRPRHTSSCLWLLALAVHKSIAFEISFRYSAGAVYRGANSFYHCQTAVSFNCDIKKNSNRNFLPPQMHSSLVSFCGTCTV